MEREDWKLNWNGDGVRWKGKYGRENIYEDEGWKCEWGNNLGKSIIR